MNGTDAGSAFAEKGCRDLAGLTNFRRKCGTHRVRYAHANDGIHAEHANANIGDVHRAALGAIASRRLAVEFGHHAVDFHALGDAVSMTPMRRGDPVAGLQRSAHTHGTSFLAGVVVHGTHGHARLDEPLQALLELADKRQALVHPEQLFARGQVLRESRGAAG